MARKSRPPVTPAAPTSVSTRWRPAVIAAAVWLTGFAIYFLGLPIAADTDLRRYEVLLLLPELLADRMTVDEHSLPSGLRYLPQRFDIVVTAMFLVAGIGALGRLLLRLLDYAGSISQRTPGERNERTTDRLERMILSFGIGITAWSLLTLLLGLLGWLSQILFAGILLASILAELAFVLSHPRNHDVASTVLNGDLSRRVLWLAGAVSTPFLLAVFLGAMLPPYDFDVKEYHLGGPKEWYLDGRIQFLPHNVYTSFPALTEMLSLSAMVIRGDWFRGALAGQTLLAGFLPLTAATIYATGRRLFNPLAGLAGAIIYLTIPWTYRTSVIAYAEGGLSCFLALSLLALVIAISNGKAAHFRFNSVALAGLFAGSAMACKYPGVVQVVIPIGLATTLYSFFRDHSSEHDASRNETNERLNILLTLIIPAAAFSLGVAIAVGPWLIKNTVETGNPVYPLLGSLIESRDWDAELNDKWRSAHRPPDFQISSFLSDSIRVTAGSDGQSLLVFGLAPLALLGAHRRVVAALWVYVAYLFLCWWLFTHRIDRFWLPLLPVACVLSGAGATAFTARSALPTRLLDHDNSLRLWRFVCGVVLVLALVLNLFFLRPPQPLGTGFLADLNAATDAAATPSIARLNETLPDGANVLLVGEAEIFDARFPLIYNTVFDRSIFQSWVAARSSEPAGTNDKLRSEVEIRQKLQQNKVTHVFVNWREILRYRTTYGFTPFVTPERFEELQSRGLLGDARIIQSTPLRSLPTDQQREAERSFPTLIHGTDDDRLLVAGVLYAVKNTSPAE